LEYQLSNFLELVRYKNGVAVYNEFYSSSHFIKVPYNHVLNALKKKSFYELKDLLHKHSPELNSTQVDLALNSFFLSLQDKHIIEKIELNKII